MRTSIEDFCYALEILLTCCVPDLKLNLNIFNLKRQCSKLNTDCHFMIVHKFIGSNSMHQTRFANTTIANHNKFEKVIMLQISLTSLVRKNITSDFIEIFGSYYVSLLSYLSISHKFIPRLICSHNEEFLFLSLLIITNYQN